MKKQTLRILGLFIWTGFIFSTIVSAGNDENLTKQYASLSEPLIYSLSPSPTKFPAGYSSGLTINEIILKNILRDMLYFFHEHNLARRPDRIMGIGEPKGKVLNPSPIISEIDMPLVSSLPGLPKRKIKEINEIDRIGERGPVPDRQGKRNTEKDGSVPGHSFRVDTVGSPDAETVVRIAIIDIDEQHAAEVRKTMEETIRAANPNARIEIATIILPGKWQADGSKEVAADAILSALDQAATWGARVINMSIGAVGGPDALMVNALQSLHNRGVLVVGASGNDYGAQDAWGGAADPFVLSVGASDGAYSNSADVYASGRGAFGNVGTSFAAPKVAAEAALLLARNANLSVEELNRILSGGYSLASSYAPAIGNNAPFAQEVLIPSYYQSPTQPQSSFEGLGFTSPQDNQLPLILW